MKKYYKERFEAQKRLMGKIAPFMEVNDILEKMRAELREIIPIGMETCILLLDPDAMAESYWYLVEQDRNSWTLELDLRPHKEDFFV